MLLPLQTFAFDRIIRIFCDKIAEAKREAGLTGPGGVLLVGHNANVHDMKVMQCSLKRAEGREGGWVERLEEAGVVGLIDTLVLLGGAFKAIALPEGQTKKLDSVYPFLFEGAALPNAHRAKGDVEGLVRITKTCESMKSCLLSKNVAQPLSVWWSRQQAMAVRAEWGKSKGREGAP